MTKSKPKLTPKTKAKAKPRKELERILFIPDCHIPYHDEYAFQLMLDAAKGFKPDHVIILGDFIDMYSVSAHDKNPQRALKLEWELAETIKCLQKVKKLGAKNNVFIAGNHCDRLERYMMSKAPELFDQVKIENLLALKGNGFQYIPYKDHYKIGKVYVTHDTGKAGKHAHLKSMADFGKSVILGHTHVMSYTIQGTAEGDHHVGAMFGWLGDFEKVDYMHKIKAKVDWSHGFGIGYLHTKTNNVYVTPVPIINKSCVVEGKLYV